MLCVGFEDYLHGPEPVLVDVIPLLLLLLELTSHSAYSQLTLHVISYLSTAHPNGLETKLPHLSISQKHVEGSGTGDISSFPTPPAQIYPDITAISTSVCQLRSTRILLQST
jgi:hypothetical protein